MDILVTGGAGFIGSRYVRGLLAGDFGQYADVRVTVLDKLTYAGHTANLPMDDPRLTFVKGDVLDGPLLDSIMPGHNAVVHFAAETHVDRSLLGTAEFVATNVLGTQTLLDSCLKSDIGRVVHISTDEVYGSIPTGSWTEEHALLPNSPYAASKAGADLLARAYHRSHGLPVMITRCANNYGPYQYTEKIIPLFVTRLLSDLEVPLYGDGSNVREWLHVDDHCRAVQSVLEHGRPGEVYNIGGGVELTNRDLTERLIRLCGADWSQVRMVTDRKGHDVRYSLDYHKIRDELGFSPTIPFERGLADVVGWYRDNRWWWAEPAATS